MTEAEWLSATEPAPMLEFLRGKPGGRKLRQVAVACFQRVRLAPAWLTTDVRLLAHVRGCWARSEAGGETTDTPSGLSFFIHFALDSVR